VPPTPPQPHRNWIQLFASAVVIALLGLLSVWLLYSLLHSLRIA
jgi:hypothetical protein